MGGRGGKGGPDDGVGASRGGLGGGGGGVAGLKAGGLLYRACGGGWEDIFAFPVL